MDDKRKKQVRLQRFLAWCGLGSRRACEGLIAQGRVQVDGVRVREPGTKVVPGDQEVRVDGERVRPEKRVCYLVNKPRGFISSNKPSLAPRRVVDLVERDPRRLYIAGRLDVDSDGLVLVTNDGELANRITHPRYEVPKTYLVLVRGHVQKETVRVLRKGVFLAEGKVRPSEIRFVRTLDKNTELEVILAEGRNREIRRIFARVGHYVKRLTRTAIGPLRLGTLQSGSAEPLSMERVEAIFPPRENGDEGKKSVSKEKRKGKKKGWAKGKRSAPKGRRGKGGRGRGGDASRNPNELQLKPKLK